MIQNMMSVDLEDYYCDLPFSTWNRYSSRVVQTTRNLLDLFGKFNVTATFFTVGYIAEKFPELIEEVRGKGHEIASHSYSHLDLRNTNRHNFEQDFVRSLSVLRKISGEKVLGFRAPYFSVNSHNLWVFDVMKKYIKYDSSIFPAGFHYKLPRAPRHVYRMSACHPLKEDTASNFFEIPMTTIRLPVLGNIPMAGGIYMRFLAPGILKKAIERFNKKNLPAIFYVHPRDLDPFTPHITTYPWHSYWGLAGAYRKLESIIRAFRFSSIRNVMSL
jgi:polysaccharide deacetylase family protein (PEP-CTERM system associated)